MKQMRKDPFDVTAEEQRESEEQHRAERERLYRVLQRAKRDWEQTFDAVPDQISIIGADHTIKRVNRALADFIGVHPRELIGRKCYEVMHQSAEPPIGCPASSMMEQGVAQEEQIEEKRLNRVFNVSTSPIVDAAGDLTSWVHVARDITEQRRKEEAKAKLEGQLQQAQKMESVGRLAGGVAHDFNNQLTVIMAYADMGLMELDPSHPLYAKLQEIGRAAERSAGLTQQLLAFARQQPVSPKVLDLNDTVRDMLKMLRRLIGEHIHLIWREAGEPCRVRMDPSQVDQVLANLCINARDAIADFGEIRIETGIRNFPEGGGGEHQDFLPGDYVFLAVSDNGCGMDEGTLKQIFEPFFTTKEIGKGTGLGLSTVYGVTRQNGGFIDVRSEKGLGTTFRIYLPRCRDEAQAAQIAAAAPVTGGAETVLLVEDEPAILAMTKSLLEQQGYRVLAARTPAEALRMAKECTDAIHLLLTDVIMTQMNGRDLARELAARRPGVKCLYMSGYTADVIGHHGVLDDEVRFIAKPFKSSELALKVREALDN